jgi:hypothetical protein
VAVPILGGGRLLGRGGGFQFGALQMRTDDDLAAAAEATNFSVLRVNRDVLSRSRVGVIATRRSLGGDASSASYTYGADAAFNPLSDLSITGYWSKVDDPDTVDRDVSYRGGLNWNADRTGLQLEHLYVGDNFSPGVGFVRRSAFRRSYGQARYSPRPANIRGVRKLTFEAGLDYYENTTGKVESRESQGQFRVEMTSSDQIGLEFTDAFEYLDAPFTIAPGVTVPIGEYTFRQGKATWFMSASRRVSGFASVSAGEFYGGTLRELSWRGRVEVSPQLSVEPQVSINHVDTPFGVGDTNVIGSRATYTLTPRMFVGALLQYQSSTKSVSSNIRFRWEYQPGSELFIVYSDLRDTDDTGFPPTMLSRSFVVKVTKLLRF